MSTKKLKKKSLDGIEYREGSDNIFADIGIPNPEEAMAKAQIAISDWNDLVRESGREVAKEQIRLN